MGFEPLVRGSGYLGGILFRDAPEPAGDAHRAFLAGDVESVWGRLIGIHIERTVNMLTGPSAIWASHEAGPRALASRRYRQARERASVHPQSRSPRGNSSCKPASVIPPRCEKNCKTHQLMCNYRTLAECSRHIYRRPSTNR